MSERIHALAQLVLGKASLEECSIEELQHLIKRYPYFALAQFLLLQKLKATGSSDSETQQRKAVLYFHDPLQFEYFISPERFYFDEESLEISRPSMQENGTTGDNRIYSSQQEGEPVPLQPGLSETEIAEVESIPETNEVQPNIKPAAFSEPSFFFAEQGDLEHPETVTPAPADIGDESSTIPVAIAPAEPESLSQLNHKEITGHEQQGDEPFREDSPTKTMTGGDVTGENLLPASADEENLELENQTGNANTTPLEEPAKKTESRPELVENTDAENKEESGRYSALAATAGKTPVLSAPENSGLAFEPFHTVDYFASQGIKISTEELPKDKLAKQLRSFTEWLKVMKRLPDADIGKVPQSPAEKSVETLASHSVEESAVITEAMAEVWVKQGNRGKAIETYNKLSLLNPSRKAYFAAKIENLKGS